MLYAICTYLVSLWTCLCVRARGMQRPVILPGPGVDPRDLETIVPRTSVFSLSFGSCAHAMAMGFALLPASTIGATVIKIEAASGLRFSASSSDPRGGQLSRGCSRRGRGLSFHPPSVCRAGTTAADASCWDCSCWDTSAACWPPSTLAYIRGLRGGCMRKRKHVVVKIIIQFEVVTQKVK